MLTCRVEVISPDGSVTQARALLDSSVSIPRRARKLKINGVAHFNFHPTGTAGFKLQEYEVGGSRSR